MKKISNENIDRVLNKLTASTHAPRGHYSAEKTWKQLEVRIQKRRGLHRLWLRAASAAAVVVLCAASWAAYNAIHPATHKDMPERAETHLEVSSVRRDPLVFRQQSLQEITRQLSETFHTEIIIEDPNLRNYRITATFQNNEDLTQILDLLKNATGNFTYKKADQTIIITKIN